MKAATFKFTRAVMPLDKNVTFYSDSRSTMYVNLNFSLHDHTPTLSFFSPPVFKVVFLLQSIFDQ